MVTAHISDLFLTFDLRMPNFEIFTVSNKDLGASYSGGEWLFHARAFIAIDVQSSAISLELHILVFYKKLRICASTESFLK